MVGDDGAVGVEEEGCHFFVEAVRVSGVDEGGGQD